MKPVEFMVRNGWITLQDLAKYLDVSKSTIYRWTVWQQSYPKGFPKAERVGQRWMVRWSAIQKWESGLMTREEEKEKGINIGNPGQLDVSVLFDYE
jgi:predicted DNA-binding transcriptional regulator AlpA